LSEILPQDVRLVDSATTCAEHLRKELERLDLLASAEHDGTLEVYLTDLSDEFEALAKRFLKRAPILLSSVICQEYLYCPTAPYHLLPY